MTEYKDQYMKKCAICGKDIYVPCADNWTYKRERYRRGCSDQRLWFCSYTCVTKWDEGNKKRKEVAE